MLAVPSVAQTNRLSGIVLLHIGMRVRITTQVLPPWAVQDATGIIMEIDASPQDQQRMLRIDNAHPDAEMQLQQLPLGVYVKLDNCDREFLPPLVCQEHQQAGFCKQCSACRSFEGWVLVEPMKRSWTFTDKDSGATLTVKRSQLPLMPAHACPLYSRVVVRGRASSPKGTLAFFPEFSIILAILLPFIIDFFWARKSLATSRPVLLAETLLYSLQGATCDPGLIAHFAMPKRADEDIKWLIVYVLLSRVRSLSNLRSVGLNQKLRKIIEGGPPAMIAENFEKLFRKKITETHAAAAAAKATLGW